MKIHYDKRPNQIFDALKEWVEPKNIFIYWNIYTFDKDESITQEEVSRFKIIIIDPSIAQREQLNRVLSPIGNETFKPELNSIYNKEQGDHNALKRKDISLIKSDLLKYPQKQRDILNTASSWCVANQFLTQWRSTNSVTITRQFAAYKFPLGGLDDFEIELLKYNSNKLDISDPSENYQDISKENLREIMHVIFDEHTTDTQALKDFRRISYLNNHGTQLDIIKRNFSEIVSKEGIDVYDDFDKLQISSNASIPHELLQYQDQTLDQSTLPVI